MKHPYHSRTRNIVKEVFFVTLKGYDYAHAGPQRFFHQVYTDYTSPLQVT